MNVFNQNPISKQYISRLQTEFILIDHGLCPGWSRETHRRKRDSIYLILDGMGKITINGTEIHPRKNNMVLLPKNSMVSLYSEDETCYNKYWCDFNMHLDDVSLFDVIKFPYMIELDDITHAKELLDRLDRLHLSTDPTSAFQIQSTLIELVSMFLEHDADASSLKENDPFCDKIRAYIQEHISESITIKELADEMCYNDKYFIDIFKQHFSSTPAKYIRSVKLEKAKQELLYTDNTITNIINRIGYSNVQMFSKDFKKHTGYSPTDFRRLFK